MIIFLIILLLFLTLYICSKNKVYIILCIGLLCGNIYRFYFPFLLEYIDLRRVSIFCYILFIIMIGKKGKVENENSNT